MRLWTVFFAVLFAFAFHLDSFRIVQELWLSPGLRASLVSNRETLLKEASVVLSGQSDSTRSSGQSVSPRILADAMKKLKEKEKDAMAGLAVPPSFINLNEAVNWLRAGLKVDENRKDSIVGTYRNLVLTEFKEQADKITQEFAKTGFQLIPTPYPGLHYDGFMNIIGILITAGLLSLGTPFWFNTLKTLGNLRPLVAGRQGKEQGDSG
jgi:hypothetical protein